MLEHRPAHADVLGGNGHNGPPVATPLDQTACLVVGAGAGLYADQARQQIGEEFKQFGAWQIGPKQREFASLIHTMHGKNVLCQIDANGYDIYKTSLSEYR